MTIESPAATDAPIPPNIAGPCTFSDPFTEADPWVCKLLALIWPLPSTVTIGSPKRDASRKLKEAREACACVKSNFVRDGHR